MHCSAIALTIVAAVIGSTSASAVAPRALVSVDQVSSSLLSRQSPCVSLCTPAQNDLSACSTGDCMCSPSLISELLDCFNCRFQAYPTLRSQLQTDWDEYSSDCATMGFPFYDTLDSATTTASSAAPAVSTTSAASVDGNGVAHANAAPNLHAGGILGLLVVGVVAALL